MTNPTTTEALSPCVSCHGDGGTDRPCTSCNGRGEKRATVLCAGCGEYEATRDELCARCDDDVAEFLGAGRDEAFTLVGLEYSAARYYVGDDEGELLTRGVRC